MKILIIDDEAVFADELRQFVNKICADDRITSEIKVTDDPEFLLMNGKGFDVVLLDIEMPKHSGLELAEKLNEQKGDREKPYIIFVTNRDGLVFEALRQQPYSFIRKSHPEELEPCLKRLVKLCGKNDHYSIKTGRDIVRLPLNDIYYLEKQKNYVYFHTARGCFPERTSLDNKSDLLAKGFLRTHIGYMVNIRHIEKLSSAEICLSDGTSVPLSKKYHDEVRKRFFEWMVNEV